MNHSEYVNFKRSVLKVGNSLMITIPSSNAEYLGIKEGSEVSVRILAIHEKEPKNQPHGYTKRAKLPLKLEKDKTVEKKTNLALIKTPPLDDVVEAMVEKLFDELEFDPGKGQSKLGE